MIAIRRVTALCYLQNVESKFCFYVGQRVFFIRNRVAILLFQFGIQNGDGVIRGDPVSVIVGSAVSKRAESKGITVNVLGVVQQSQDKVSAPHIVRQVTEEMASVWIITHVLDDGAAISITVCFFELFFRGTGKALQKQWTYIGFPGA